jgi:hypothetical protein
MGLYVGAVGDYNGDGVDDFVTKIGRYIQSLCIFAGSREWRVNDVSEVQPETYDMTLNVSPNPFNSSTQLEFTLAQSCHARLTIYDLTGREVDAIVDKSLPRGDHTRFCNIRTAGIYFAVLKTAAETKVVKLICLP